MSDAHSEQHVTYRVYVRWPQQKVSQKTSTYSKRLADMAWEEVLQIDWGDVQPVGISYTANNKAVKHHHFSKDQEHRDD